MPDKKKCGYCGKELEIKKFGPKKRFCNSKCRMRKKGNVILGFYKRKCERCGKEFKTIRQFNVYCCSKCRLKNGREKCSDKEKNGRFVVFIRDNFTCAYCGRNVFEDKIKLQVDHIIPRAKGGSDERNNLVTSCGECNRSKKDKLLSKEIIEKIKKRKIIIHESIERGLKSDGKAL